ncbi:hypothetical protein [Bradyrhizobium sp. USDA 4473]
MKQSNHTVNEIERINKEIDQLKRKVQKLDNHKERRDTMTAIGRLVERRNKLKEQ